MGSEGLRLSHWRPVWAGRATRKSTELLIERNRARIEDLTHPATFMLNAWINIEGPLLQWMNGKNGGKNLSGDKGL